MEESLRERVVAGNASFVAVVPFWAVWPFEVMVLPRRHVPRLEALVDTERSDFAAILRAVTATYDQVFDTPFPYSMGLHPAPCDGQEHPEWQFHAHFYPPLLRSASIRKFMVGFELLGGPQRDITPESAAEVLRQASMRVSD
jgi:UDPglucose--hexose-1-phosphate uridylyltransferase